MYIHQSCILFFRRHVTFHFLFSWGIKNFPGKIFKLFQVVGFLNLSRWHGPITCQSQISTTKSNIYQAQSKLAPFLLAMKHAYITLTDLISLVFTHPTDQLTTFSFHISFSNTVVSSNYCLEHVRQKSKLKHLSSFSVCLRHTPRLLIEELRYCQRIPPVIATSTT